MNHEWLRGGIALLCLAGIGGLIWLGMGGPDGGPDLLRALAIVCGIAGLAFVGLGATKIGGGRS